MWTFRKLQDTDQLSLTALADRLPRSAGGRHGDGFSAARLWRPHFFGYASLTMNSTAAVYIAQGDGLLPDLRRFATAYRRHWSGAEHALLVLFQGVSKSGVRSAGVTIARRLSARIVELGGSYTLEETLKLVAERVSADDLIFLRGDSEPLAGDWLRLMLDTLASPGVGLVGATASCASRSAEAQKLHAFFGEDPGLEPLAHHRLVRALESGADVPSGVDGAAAQMRWERAQAEAPWRTVAQEPSFPNPHLRLSAFATRRELLLELLSEPFEAGDLESGSRCLSRRVWERKLQAVVVGRDGQSYSEPEWRNSQTFRSGGQRNLLIGDAETRAFDSLSQAGQSFSEGLTWGPLSGQAKLTVSPRVAEKEGVAEPPMFDPAGDQFVERLTAHHRHEVRRLQDALAKNDLAAQQRENEQARIIIDQKRQIDFLLSELPPVPISDELRTWTPSTHEVFTPVSLGDTCMTKFQISRVMQFRRWPESSELGFRLSMLPPFWGRDRFGLDLFDWQGTPFQAVRAYLRSDFQGLFNREDLEVVQNEVIHRKHRTNHIHDFEILAKYPPDRANDETVDQWHGDASALFHAGAAAFRDKLHQEGPFLYVHACYVTPSEWAIYDLVQLMRSYSPQHRFRLLFLGLLEPAVPWGSFGNLVAEKVIRSAETDKPKERQWEGPDDPWDEALKDYRLRFPDGEVV